MPCALWRCLLLSLLLFAARSAVPAYLPPSHSSFFTRNSLSLRSAPTISNRERAVSFSLSLSLSLSGSHWRWLFLCCSCSRELYRRVSPPTPRKSASRRSGLVSLTAVHERRRVHANALPNARCPFLDDSNILRRQSKRSHRTKKERRCARAVRIADHSGAEDPLGKIT